MLPSQFSLNTRINEPHAPICFSKELKQIINDRNLFTAKSRKEVCSILGSPPDDKNIDKRFQFRLQAIAEIMKSEKTYLKQLEILMKYFIIPLKEKSIITEIDHKKLFGQIGMIYNLNGEFLKNLESDLDNVATLVLKMAPFFKVYSIYAFDFKSSLLILQKLNDKNPVFRQFLQDTESRPEVQTKLDSLMIIPIQRIPRYKLLLEQVLLYTSPADSDFKMFKESLKLIESTASHINSVVEDQEDTQNLLNLQNSLVDRTPNIVTPSRKIIKQGILYKVTRNGTQIKRFCILMSDIFMYCKILKDRPKNILVENSLECCCIFPLKKCKVYELFPGNFKISCQGDGLLFCTMDVCIGQSWIVAIKDTIDLYMTCRQTLRKESSKRKPIRRKHVRNFEIDSVFIPNSRKVNYKSFFHFGRGDKCFAPSFKIPTMRSKIFKYKDSNRSLLEVENRPTEFPQGRKYLAQGIVQKQQLSPSNNSTTKDEVPQLSFTEPVYKNSLHNPLDDQEQSYGFANQLSKSYSQANNINSVTREDFEQVIANGISQNLDTLYPLRVTRRRKPTEFLLSEKGIKNAHNTWKINSRDDSPGFQQNRRKFNDINISKNMMGNIYLNKLTHLQAPQSFKFSTQNNDYKNGNCLRKRVGNFFSRLF